MEWPDAAHDFFVGLPVEHRVVALYVILAVGAVGVLMALRRWLSSTAAPTQQLAAAAPSGPSLEQMTQALNAAIDRKFNGSPTRIERLVEALSAKVDRLDEKVDGQGERLARVEEWQIARAQWDGNERRGPA